jgi:hypothetical protein
MSMPTTNTKTRRKPRLRVVSPSSYRKHAAGFRLYAPNPGPLVVEVFTFQEWSQIPERCRPSEDVCACLPGVGFVCVEQVSEEELADVTETSEQAWQAYLDAKAEGL